MTTEEIIAMAREAGFGNYAYEAANLFERFAALVAAKEREACAQVCEAIRTNPPKGEPDDVERWFNGAIRRSAAAIRVRGQKEG